MRWIVLLILAFLVLLVQTSLGRVLTISLDVGPIAPDWAAMTAVFIALRARQSLDALIAAWILGMGVDLASSGGLGSSTVVGPMAMAYCLGCGMVFRVREAFFREKALSQAVLCLGFVLIAHWTWLLIQAIRTGQSWGNWGDLFMQVLLVALYSAVLAPLAHFLLSLGERVLFVSPSGGRGRM